MLARPCPAASPMRVTGSPTKFVPLVGDWTMRGDTALVLQTLVTASSNVVATTRFVMSKKALPKLPPCRKPYPNEAAGVVTASEEVTLRSLVEMGLTQIVPAKEVTGSH